MKLIVCGNCGARCPDLALRYGCQNCGSKNVSTKDPMNDQRSLHDQMEDLKKLAREHGLYDALDLIEHRIGTFATDPYKAGAAHVLDIPIENVDKAQRQRFKEALHRALYTATIATNNKPSVYNPQPQVTRFVHKEKHTITLDGVEHRYHVRERDNRVAIIVSQPGWAAAIDHDFWYVSIEDLDGSKWQHREGSTHAGGGMSHVRAMQIVEELYAREAQKSGAK